MDYADLHGFSMQMKIQFWVIREISFIFLNTFIHKILENSVFYLSKLININTCLLK